MSPTGLFLVRRPGFDGKRVRSVRALRPASAAGSEDMGSGRADRADLGCALSGKRASELCRPCRSPHRHSDGRDDPGMSKRCLQSSKRRRQSRSCVHLGRADQRPAGPDGKPPLLRTGRGGADDRRPREGPSRPGGLPRRPIGTGVTLLGRARSSVEPWIRLPARRLSDRRTAGSCVARCAPSDRR